MSRKAVSEKIQAGILCKCRRRCALCFGLDNDFSEKKGQIAHIDRDNTNNNEENLVFLCLDHHNLYDSKFKQTKKLTKKNLKIILNVKKMRILNMLMKIINYF